MSIKLGIVGTNFISDRLWHAVQYVPEVEVCAVYSRRQETGDAFAKKYGIEQVYTDYELFLNSDLDAVYIATPTYAHCPQTLQALEQGKHVLCEKIMAVNDGMCEEESGGTFGSNASGIRSGISVDHGQPSENRKVTASDIGILSIFFKIRQIPTRRDTQCISSGVGKRCDHGYWGISDLYACANVWNAERGESIFYETGKWI